MTALGDDFDKTDLDRRSVLGLATGAAIGVATTSVPQPASASILRSDIVMMDAIALSSAIHTRQLSCAEVMTAYLDHIDRINPRVNAIVALEDRAKLLAQATERDVLLARGESMGPLHGFPHAPKDLQAVKGIRSTQGSPILKDFIPAADSLMVERLRKAGVIFIGKTNTPEMTMDYDCDNPVFGQTNNPWNHERVPGGSSGGEAAALAAGMSPL